MSLCISGFKPTASELLLRISSLDARDINCMNMTIVYQLRSMEVTEAAAASDAGDVDDVIIVDSVISHFRPCNGKGSL